MTDVSSGPEVAPHRPALVAAALLTGAALQIDNGFYTPIAVSLIGVALASAWAAMLAPVALARVIPDRDTVVAALLFLGVEGQLVTLLRAPIGMYFAAPLPVDHPGFVIGLIVAAMTAGLAVLGGRVGRRIAAIALLAVATGLGALTYRASPDPHIDVVTVHDAAYEALARGESPYSISFKDIYGGSGAFYPDGMVKDGVVQYGFPYPPLSLAMTWPGHRAGDFRYSELAAWIGAALCLIVAGRGSAVAVLAAAVVLFTPRAFFGLEQAWTDPLAALWLAGAVAFAASGRLLPAAIAVGLAAATKQHAVVAVPLLILLVPRGWQARVRLVVASGIAAALALTPALADPSGFLRSAVLVQVRENLRYDSLSLAVTYATAVGRPLPGAVYALVVLGAIALAAWRAPRTPAGFATALGAVLLTTFTFGKKAFCNYYLFALVALALAIAVRRSDPSQAPRQV